MKAQLLFLEVLVSFLPALAFLTWGVVLWFAVIEEVFNLDVSAFGIGVFFSVPMGIAGFLGVITLTLNLVTDKKAMSMSMTQKLCLTSGILAALIAGAMMFFSSWLFSLIVLLPIAVTVHLIVLHYRKLNSTSH
ncbi:hypothetical protein [Aliikangiella sp. IMCC44359]|uniref:hypothetical protein n=1 Tax=Aliikangiella sp. IMCC44359 TaxID=3459125 RepID=UPI00403AC517